ncbi:type II toxin-antitoxin system HicB family antitoxin [Candidatus Gottesmanbacteria bacterium]|nr:type II toxin-antitoxin system HicB family antitoxin [Candidatus Gottesmanbacteria bacterium]
MKTKTKKKINHKIYNYTAIFEPAEEGGFTALIPALPGCVSEGDTFEEALKNIKEATALYLEVAQEEKMDIIRDKQSVIVAPIRIAV